MNIITAVFVLAGLLTISQEKCEASGADIRKMSFDEMAGPQFPALLEAVRSPGQDMPVPDAWSARPGGDAAQPAPVAREESEIKRCPPGPVALGGSPDQDIYTYVGYRYVRADGTTCGPQPSDRIYYREPAEKELFFRPDPEGNGQASYKYSLQSREYIVRRDFFFRTQLDGSRLFYSHDANRYTGKQLPEGVELNFLDRAEHPLFPWEAPESFRLRYGAASGAALSPQDTNYEYAVSPAAGSTPEGDLLTRFDIKVIRKKRLTPPESGAVTLAPVNGGNTLVLDVRDSRAKYYGKEKLGLRVRLWKNVFLWPDSVAYEMDMELDAASRILIDLADHKWDKYKKEAIEAGGEYYAEWSFRRAGSAISSGEWIDKGKTDGVTVGAK